jgi:hypothetical protein
LLLDAGHVADTWYLWPAGPPLTVMTTRTQRRHTIAAVVSIALLLPLAACADGSVATAPAPPTATPSPGSEPSAKSQPPVKSQPPPESQPHPRSQRPVTTRPKSTPKRPSTKPVLGTDLFGTQYAYLKSAKANLLTFDLVQYFKNEAAGKACDADHVYASEGVWCVDYYIRNRNPRLRVLGADPYGPYRLLTDDGPVEVSLWRFIAALRGKNRVFKFYVDGGRILHADEVPA